MINHNNKIACAFIGHTIQHRVVPHGISCGYHHWPYTTFAKAQGFSFIGIIGFKILFIANEGVRGVLI